MKPNPPMLMKQGVGKPKQARPDDQLPFLKRAELDTFKSLRLGGQYIATKVRHCPACKGEVPMRTRLDNPAEEIPTFCSQKCYRASEAQTK